MTYIAPLAFVLLVTMGKEAYDDYKRNLCDRKVNSARHLASPRALHLTPTRKSYHILCLKGISHPRAPFHLPPYVSATSPC